MDALPRRFALIAIFAWVGVSPVAWAGDPFLRRTATVTAVEQVGPAVVSIASTRMSERNPFGSMAGNPGPTRFFRDIFDSRLRRDAREDIELGSGVIIDPEGHVLTNEHVVARASLIRVKLADGRQFDASVVGADPNNDLAVLQIETQEELPWVEPGRSDDLLVGEPVIAIGNPFGLSNTVTTGVISALDRSFQAPDHSYFFHGFMQTDASINPGNSGGPLLNAEGQLIGINSALYKGGEGIGFAIPIDVAKRVVSELIEHGEVTPIWLGAEFQTLDPGLYEVMDVPGDTRGVLITGVRQDSPAAHAGLKRGDVLSRIDGHELESARGVLDYLRTVLVGQQLQLDVWRKPTLLTLKLRAQEIPESEIRALTRDYLGLELESSRHGPLGFAIKEVRPGSVAARVGFMAGDRLLRLNGLRLRSKDDLRRAVVDLRGRDRASVVVQRGDGRYHVTIPLV
jgi:serine protease Do